MYIGLLFVLTLRGYFVLSTNTKDITLKLNNIDIKEDYVHSYQSNESLSISCSFPTKSCSSNSFQCINFKLKYGREKQRNRNQNNIVPPDKTIITCLVKDTSDHGGQKCSQNNGIQNNCYFNDVLCEEFKKEDYENNLIIYNFKKTLGPSDDGQLISCLVETTSNKIKVTLKLKEEIIVTESTTSSTSTEAIPINITTTNIPDFTYTAAGSEGTTIDDGTLGHSIAISDKPWFWIIISSVICIGLIIIIYMGYWLWKKKYSKNDGLLHCENMEGVSSQETNNLKEPHSTNYGYVEPTYSLPNKTTTRDLNSKPTQNSAKEIQYASLQFSESQVRWNRNRQKLCNIQEDNKEPTYSTIMKQTYKPS